MVYHGNTTTVPWYTMVLPWYFFTRESLQARHRVREDDEVLISAATDNVKCQADCIEFCSKDACVAW